jgi:predicted nucleic acid-binding protein
MRIVLDTNVLISAALKENTPPEAAVHLVAASHRLRAADNRSIAAISRHRLVTIRVGVRRLDAL